MIRYISKVISPLKSRTILTVLTIFLVNGVGAIQTYIPAEWLPLVNGILSILAIYFRVDQKRDFREE